MRRFKFGMTETCLCYSKLSCFATLLPFSNKHYTLSRQHLGLVSTANRLVFNHNYTVNTEIHLKNAVLLLQVQFWSFSGTTFALNKRDV